MSKSIPIPKTGHCFFFSFWPATKLVQIWVKILWNCFCLLRLSSWRSCLLQQLSSESPLVCWEFLLMVQSASPIEVFDEAIRDSMMDCAEDAFAQIMRVTNIFMHGIDQAWYYNLFIDLTCFHRYTDILHNQQHHVNMYEILLYFCDTVLFWGTAINDPDIEVELINRGRNLPERAYFWEGLIANI